MDNIRIKPVWSKSKDEIWDEMFEHLDEHPDEHPDDHLDDHPDEHRPPEKGILRRIPVWGYAASLLIPVLLICHFYSITVETARGEHAVVTLPDRSTVTVNAESKVSYKPLEWFVSRRVKLQGEACFEVEHGSSFHVLSGNNRVKVLGTTFNVYARAETYRVTCLSGRVEALAGKESVVLQANMQAVFDKRQFHIHDNVQPAAVTGWMQGMFVFVETPLNEVIAEVERQYNVNVVAPDYDPNHLYTGNFSKLEKPEEILEIIGKAYGLTFSIR
jgi:ferric-dicitrate binding protein FerR (iron transport regulator)